MDDPADLITVVDLPHQQMLQCMAKHLVPVETARCPENQVQAEKSCWLVGDVFWGSGDALRLGRYPKKSRLIVCKTYLISYINYLICKV